MRKLRPVSMQRIRGALDTQHLKVEVSSSGSWMVTTPTHVLTADLNDPHILHFKATSTREFVGHAAFARLSQLVNDSNQEKISPKAYIEKAGGGRTYTVSAEVSRLVKSGLSGVQFSAFCEEAVHVLYSFFGDLEAAVTLEATNEN